MSSFTDLDETSYTQFRYMSVPKCFTYIDRGLGIFLLTTASGSGVHPASYPMGTRGSFSGDKAGGA